jgi:zinc transport system substrate-binding protein
MAGWSRFVFCAVVVLASGCGGQQSAAPDGRLAVAVSVLPQKWLVEQLADGRVEVTTLVLPGDNPHTYQPSDAQVSRLMKAAVFFRAGVPFENGPWFQALQRADRLRIVDLREGLTLLEMGDHAHHAAERGPDKDAHEHEKKEAHAHQADAPGHEACAAEGKDPHAWLSVRTLKIQAATMARTLVAIDPAHKADYERRLAELQQRLDALDAALAAKLAAVRGRAFFVFHPAWGYFAHDYGLRQVAIEVDGKEPSDRELTEIQHQARESGAKTILVQPQISGRGAEAVASATGARVVVADPLAENLPETLTRVADVLVLSAVKGK